MSFWNPWAEVRQLRARLELAEGEIAKAHFRNPATGRLGRRGQTFSQEQS